MRRPKTQPMPRNPVEIETRALPIEVVGAAIVAGGRCLVAQRGSAMSSPWLWEFPGGKVEPGEDPRAALAREIREELGLEVDVGASLGRGSSLVAGRRIELEVFLAHPRGGVLRLAEHHACAWLTAAELDALDWAAADLPILPACKIHLESAGVTTDPDTISARNIAPALDRKTVRT